MNPDSKITLFRNYYNPDPVIDITIYQFCDYIINSFEFAKDITAIRDPKVSKEERDRIKATFPAVTISGSFTKRNEAGLIRHSGFICLDIDQGKNDITDWPALRNDIMNCDNVYFAALSASGKGVFCLVPVAFPHKHKQQAIQLIKDFESATGLKLDQAPTSVASLRGISHDPEAKFNKSAIKYYGVYQEPKKEQYKRSAITNYSPIETVKRMIKEAVEGERHETILRASILLGGYISAGKLSESEAEAVLRSEAENKLPLPRHQGAYKTISDGIKHGKQKPIER